MDEIADCIADHQYGEAIRKSGVGDPLDALASSILERIPEPPSIKDPAEREKVSKDFANSLTLDTIMEEPLGRYMLGWCVTNKGKVKEKEMEGILQLLNDVEDFEKLQNPDPIDVCVVCDTLMETCPQEYVGMIDEIAKRADALEEEIKTHVHEALAQKKDEGGEGGDGVTPRSPREYGISNIDLAGVFDAFKKKLNDDIFAPVFEDFKSDETCEKYRKAKWYADQPVTIDNFIVFRDLGRGAFGVVSGGRLRTTGEMVALKGMNRKLVKGKKVKKLVKGEKEILKLLGERPSLFCVWLKYSFCDANNMYFALPLMTGGDLQYHLRLENKSFGIERTRFFAAEIMLGLSHMHALGIVYRDLKPENVLLDDEGHTRISDMGLAVDTRFTPKTRGDRTIRGKAGTPGYWPPQMINGNGYAFDADWWSFGCCLYEFMAGCCPFSEHNTKMKDRNDGTLNWDIQFPDNPDKQFPPELKDLILLLLNRNPEERLGTGPESAEPIMNHPFFEPIDWKKFSRHQVPAPWTPPKDAINAVSQADLEDRNKEYEYRKLKLSEEDDIPNFEYTSHAAHHRDICTVFKLDRMGKLDHLKKGGGSSACNLI